MIFSTVYQPVLTATIRNQPVDFIVDEVPLFTPSGEGEHLFLKIRKTGTNTDWLAGQLARLLNVKRRDIGFAGLKDRNAVTTQWFSVYLPGKETPDVSAMLPESLASVIEVVEQTRHTKKLRRGSLEGNHFTLVLRDCVVDKSQLASLLAQIGQRGIPNYFGEQRFGFLQSNNDHPSWSNIESALAWFSGQTKKPKNRNQRSMYLSAARSWIFNHILSARVEDDSWDKAVKGDVFMLGNSHSWFTDDGDEQLAQRVEQFEIHPGGALWGQGALDSAEGVRLLEQQIAEQHAILCKGLEMNGLKQQRRSLRIQASDLQHQWLDETSLQLTFTLPAGSYATVFLDQIIRS